MKAIIHKHYGSPDLLELMEVAKPVPKGNELLIKVHATTVNRTDCAMLRAKPFIMRFFTGLIKPKNHILGTDFAGVIEEIGPKVMDYKIGDKVFGLSDSGLSSHAEYMIFPQDKALALMPDNITFEEATASLEGTHYAYNMINKLRLVRGDEVLVNGGSGAIGSAAVQLLKYYGAKVTAVCDTKNLELMKSLGADTDIDYEKEDFTKRDQKYNFILDTVGKSTFGRCKPLLKSKGAYISSELGPYSQNLFYALYTARIGDKKVIFPIPFDCKRSVDLIKKLIEEGKFKAVIDRKYLLDQTAEAFKYVETGQKTGNVVIVLDQKLT